MMANEIGTVYWITGLSGAGKSSLAVALHEELLQAGRKAVMLDGDAIRDLVIDAGGFDRESRLKIAKFNARLCRFLACQGVDVVCATISLFHEVQAWNHEHIQTYIEIFLDAPMQVLETRDSKGIYARARRGEDKQVVGIDIAAEWPKNPDFRFQADGQTTIPSMVKRILSTNRRGSDQ